MSAIQRILQKRAAAFSPDGRGESGFDDLRQEQHPTSHPNPGQVVGDTMGFADPLDPASHYVDATPQPGRQLSREPVTPEPGRYAHRDVGGAPGAGGGLMTARNIGIAAAGLGAAGLLAYALRRRSQRRNAA